ncbi:MAG: cob(I)yrinic acid a,c-diamide adenosyltransferase [Candidatus Omnitrophica bacterium]|nr:cob(I)yrinic acid a,c-diamide adenosyltransferase [Candidatus Omnitrophota bacterium]MDD5355000.1 cob(I)yrinic acid a,c-diamide adenosyltransferase [Candidatus Omnitrophota bacterium]
MLQIYYGKGKGKTSSALGLILRASAYNKRIILFQFFKPSKIFSGEHLSLKKLKNVKQVRFNQQHPMFLKNSKKQTPQELKKNIDKTILELKKILRKKDFDILVCDEILNVIHKNLVKENKIVKIFCRIKNDKEIILTGRNKPDKLLKIADYVTEFSLKKHPFKKGILARKSIEF